MFKAFALVRNFDSSAESVDLGEFTIKSVGPRFQELREVFSSADVNVDDWVFEKSYAVEPAGIPGSAGGGIESDVEDALLLLRLYHPGDISFIKHATVTPSGSPTVQRPYRAMNDLNSYSPLRFQVDTSRCEEWVAFARRIRAGQSWQSDWFKIARRFFLSGGAKKFNPESDDIDRISDYVISLESTLVPENGHNTSRLSRRAAALIGAVDAQNTDIVAKFIKKVYEIRSRIVHGNRLSGESLQWISENSLEIELRVRQVLATAVQKLLAREEERRVALAGLYDPTDSDRGNAVFEKFREIKTPEVRKAIAARIAAAAGL